MEGVETTHSAMGMGFKEAFKAVTRQVPFGSATTPKSLVDAFKETLMEGAKPHVNLDYRRALGQVARDPPLGLGFSEEILVTNAVVRLLEIGVRTTGTSPTVSGMACFTLAAGAPLAGPASPRGP